MELDVFSFWLVSELDEEKFIVEASVLDGVSRIVIIWDELDGSCLFQVKIEESVVIIICLNFNEVVSSDMEVLIGGFYLDIG